MNEKRIYNSTIKGYEQPCTICRKNHKMIATGYLIKNDLSGMWSVEFQCPVSNELIQKWNVDFEPLINKDLTQNDSFETRTNKITNIISEIDAIIKTVKKATDKSFHKNLKENMLVCIKNYCLHDKAAWSSATKLAYKIERFINSYFLPQHTSAADLVSFFKKLEKFFHNDNDSYYVTDHVRNVFLECLANYEIIPYALKKFALVAYDKIVQKPDFFDTLPLEGPFPYYSEVLNRIWIRPESGNAKESMSAFSKRPLVYNNTYILPLGVLEHDLKKIKKHGLKTEDEIAHRLFCVYIEHNPWNSCSAPDGIVKLFYDLIIYLKDNPPNDFYYYSMRHLLLDGLSQFSYLSKIHKKIAAREFQKIKLSSYYDSDSEEYYTIIISKPERRCSQKNVNLLMAKDSLPESDVDFFQRIKNKANLAKSYKEIKKFRNYLKGKQQKPEFIGPVFDFFRKCKNTCNNEIEFVQAMRMLLLNYLADFPNLARGIKITALGEYINWSDIRLEVFAYPSDLDFSSYLYSVSPRKRKSVRLQSSAKSKDSLFPIMLTIWHKPEPCKNNDDNENLQNCPIMYDDIYFPSGNIAADVKRIQHVDPHMHSAVALQLFLEYLHWDIAGCSRSPEKIIELFNAFSIFANPVLQGNYYDNLAYILMRSILLEKISLLKKIPNEVKKLARAQFNNIKKWLDHFDSEVEYIKRITG